jgi:hypothetical protein
MAAIPRWYLSGGTSNTNPSNSLGGAISTTQVPGNLFDDVLGSESSVGDIEYRGVYVKNDGDVDLQATVIWIQVNTPDVDTSVSIGLTAAGPNQTMETVPDEDTAPVGVVFTAPATKPVGLSMGTLPPGQRYGVWIRRTVNAGAAAYNNDTFTIRVEGDTGA